MGAVLIVAPTGRDAALARGTLSEAGVVGEIVPDLGTMVAQLDAATGAALIAEEALTPVHTGQLLEWLRAQPRWSDLPLLILSSAAANENDIAQIVNFFSTAGNVTLIERPVRPLMLVSAVQAALRARQRQNEVRRLIEQREMLLSSISDAFSALDRDWRYIYVNQRIAQLAGIPRDQLLGRKIWEVFPEAVGTEFYECCHRVMTGKEPEQLDFYYEPFHRWLETRIYPSEEGIVIFRADITERKRQEERARADAILLEKAKREAEEANRAKDQFLAMLSHELRTPLTPVLMTIASLRREPDLSDDLRRDLEMLQRNVELEALLIDDLLDLTRIAHGKLALHSDAVDLHASLEHALTIARTDIEGKRLQVRRQLNAEEHYCWADAARLQQLFWNLVKNAVKFTPAGGWIEVRTRNDEARQIVVEVADSGIGIQPTLLPRIFDAFEQGGRLMTNEFGGLGLGLAISKKVVDLHGGSIAATSAGPGQGATITVTLKAMATSLLESPAVYLPLEATPGDARILLVEDHGDTARVLQRILEHAGYQVAHATNLAHARELAAEAVFDLVISDVGLPDGSGLDLMRFLQTHHGLAGIALSGFGTVDDLAASAAAGFEEHLTKPVDWPQLRGAIDRLLAKRHQRKIAPPRRTRSARPLLGK